MRRRGSERVPKRPDDFAQRRKHLDDLSDEELKERFWALTDELVQPLVELAREHTSPSIERSVLLRMGFSSLEAGELVSKFRDMGLLSRGVGHVVWKVAEQTGRGVREAGLQLLEGDHWDAVAELFEPEGRRGHEAPTR